MSLRIVVPDNSDKNDVDYTLGKIVDSKKSDWDDITVWAWKDSEEQTATTTAYTMGMKEHSTCN